MTDVEGFLLELIQNNIITYIQDRKNRDWTFRYYVQNAKDRLTYIHAKFEKKGASLDLPGPTKGKKPQEWWEMHQEALEDAITAFEKILKAHPPKAKSSKPATPKPKNSN